MSVLPLLCLGCISLGERKISPFYLLPKNKTFVFLDASNRSLFLSQRLILVLLLLLSLATMETASKREKNVGGFRYPPPPAAHPMPQLHVCPIPIPSPLCCMYYRICIFSFFFFSSFPLFLLPCIQDYETLLWALPSLLLLLFTLVVCG